MLKPDETVITKATKEENKRIREQRKKQRMALAKVPSREKFQQLAGSYRCPHPACIKFKRFYQAAAFLIRHLYSDLFLNQIDD